MGIKDKIIKDMMGKSMTSLQTVLESIHCHLEIQSRELIKMRHELRHSSEMDEDEVDGVIGKYEEFLS